MELNEFIDYLKQEKKTSENTCEAYNRDLAAFERFFIRERNRYLRTGLEHRCRGISDGIKKQREIQSNGESKAFFY